MLCMILRASFLDRLFPSTPLAGVFGYGELGWDSGIATAEEERDLFHGYTTIFVRIGFKN